MFILSVLFCVFWLIFVGSLPLLLTICSWRNRLYGSCFVTEGKEKCMNPSANISRKNVLKISKNLVTWIDQTENRYFSLNVLPEIQIVNGLYSTHVTKCIYAASLHSSLLCLVNNLHTLLLEKNPFFFSSVYQIEEFFSGSFLGGGCLISVCN